MKKNLFILFVSFCGLLTSQIGINTKTPDPSASLEVNSDQGKKGFLLPRVTTEQRNAIQNPAAGLQVFNTTTECTETFTGSKGWYNLCNFSYIKFPWDEDRPYNGIGYYFDSEISSSIAVAHSTFIFNNKLYSWGANFYGNLGNNSSIPSNIPVEVYNKGVLSGKTITKISSGSDYSLALSSDGKLYSWGHNDNGDLGNNLSTNSNIPVSVNMSGVLVGKIITKISTGNHHSLVLSSEGKLYSWGGNFYGNIGNNSNTNSNIPVEVYSNGILSGKTITKISIGNDHNLVLSSDGKIYSWGRNDFGQLGNNSNANSNIPVAVNMSGVLAGKIITKISIGSDHNLVLSSDRKLYAWGLNDNGQLGNNSTTNSNVPIPVDANGALKGKIITKISAGLNHNLILTSDGKLYSWGHNSYGQLGNNSTINSNIPIEVNMNGVLTGKTIVDVYATGDNSYALDSEGNLYAWGDNHLGKLGDGTKTNALLPVIVLKPQ